MRTLHLFLLIAVFASWNMFITEVDTVKKGNSALKGHKYKEAEALYKEAQEKRAAELKLKYNLALVYMALSQWTDAERDMITATGSDDADFRREANYFAGIIRFHLGDIARGNKDPKEAGKHIAAAELKYREALDNFKRVLEADPANDEARHNFELTLERLEDLQKEKDQQQKKKEEQEKKDQKDKKDQNKKDNNKKDPNKKDQKKDQKKDPNKKDQKKDQKKDPNKKDQKKQDQKKDQDKDKKKQDPKKQDQKKQQKSQQKKDPQKNQQNQPQPNKSQPKKQLTPQQRAAKKALRDLKERQRERLKELYRRMGNGRRTPIKDW